jgi:hypothetical protein
VAAVSIDKEWEEMWDRWGRLDMRGAKELLDYLAPYQPAAVSHHLDLVLKLAYRRDTVLVIVGAGERLDVGTGAAAARLKAKINQRKARSTWQWAGVYTDVGAKRLTEWTEPAPSLIELDCPMIAIGSPEVNQLTADLRDEDGLPLDALLSTDEISVHHGIRQGKRRVALWGQNTKTDTDAVELFISSGLLDEYLNMIWGER